ncbi:LOW QUALITY PROTEIN: hydroxylysine kinase-like [Pristis pectinata]|uniref:LOW QUALITY PROTEIN: hydroxylysine kinase-like n=1 Tax=Pristis pectinata TaxID=685728 RepID=UPI00223E68F1|nr:LOW QUALITY PROTEIN: hydroxylysine kinase-like [Pristis pectinata]
MSEIIIKCLTPRTAVQIKPSLSNAQAVELVGRLYGLKVSEVQPMPSLLGPELPFVLVHETQGSGDHMKSYVLKVMNAADSQDADLVEAQTQVMMFLNQKGFPSSTPIPTTDGKIMSLETIKQGNDYKQYMVRLLTYLPGIPLAKFTLDHRIYYELGRTVAQMDKMLHEEFRHPTMKSLHRDKFIWNLSNTNLLERYLHEMEEGETLMIIKQVIQQFKEKIRPNLHKFRQGFIHGDCNDYNILLQSVDLSADQTVEKAEKTSPELTLRISGILDFGDMSYGCFVYELAITISYLMIDRQDPLSVGGHVIAGFESVIPLREEERGAVFLLVLCRFCQMLVMARHNVLLQPENEDYLTISSRNGWRCLQQLWRVGKEAAERIWFDVVKSYQQ